jgi:hypothetical protein
MVATSTTVTTSTSQNSHIESLFFYYTDVCALSTHRRESVIRIDALQRRHQRGQLAVARLHVTADVSFQAFIAQRRTQVEVPVG